MDCSEYDSGWCGWLVQAVEHVTLHLRVVSLSPTLGVEPTKKKKKKDSGWV